MWWRRLVACAAACLAAAGAPAADGAALFALHCAACHRADGTGTVGLAPTLKGEHWARLGADRGYLPTVLVHGISGAIKVGGTTFVGAMPAFAQLADDELAALATHVRSALQGAVAEAAYAAADIQAARARAGSPPQTRQQRLKLLGG
jgi:mono/diheme cytochrome c family protein